jgi:hypothetical protein
MWEGNRGNYNETLEVNCELEKRYKLIFYEFKLIARVEQATPRGIEWPEQTNPTISDRTPLRYYRFCSCRFASPVFNINFLISLCFYPYTYRSTAYTLVFITSTSELNLSVCCCPLHTPAEHTSILYSSLRNLTNMYGSHSH